MKRGTPRHPKMDHLQGLLRVDRWAAVGILESLWHFAGGYAPRGDVGRYSNAELAAAIEWRADPDELVNAMVVARWLDRCDCHRLRIHDWPDHADQTCQRREEIKRHGFLSCYKDAAARELAFSASRKLVFSASSQLAFSANNPADLASQPLPLPLPLPAPEPLPLPLRPPAAPEPAPAPEPPPTPSSAAWDRVLAHVEKQVPAETFATWFRPTWIAWSSDIPPDELRVFVPNNQFRTWITRNYREVLDKAMRQAGVGKLRLTLVLPEERPP